MGRFDGEVSCITVPYQRLIYRRIRTKSCHTIGFYFSDRVTGPPEEYGVHNCWWPFPFHDYVDAHEQAKKRMILESLQSALLWLCGKEKWDTGPLVEAYQTMLERDLRFEGESKRAWLSPDRRFRARIHFDFDIDKVQFTAVLRGRSSQDVLARKPLGTVKPMEGAFLCAAAASWISPTMFQTRASPHMFARFEWTADFSDVINATNPSKSSE